MTPNPQYPYPGTSRKKSAGLSLSVLLALASSVSLAQQTIEPSKTGAKPPTDDEIVQLEEFSVVGIRASAMKSMEVKKNNIQFVDAIVSEDIGKFPDNNVTESLQRVPGIQVTGYGRGQIATVHIRGLPDVTTTLNGSNIFTTTGNSFSLQDMPASLLKQVDVMKTRSAAHIESGLAGVLDIQTFRPFDFSGRKVNLAVKGTFNEQADKWQPNISALVSNRWKIGSTGKFGVLLNGSYSRTSYRDQSIETGARFPFASAAGNPGITSFFNGTANGLEPFQRVYPTPEGWFLQQIIPTGIESFWTPGLDSGLPTKAGSTFGQIINRQPGDIPQAALDAEYYLAPDAIIQTDGVGKTKRTALNMALQYAPNDTSEYTFEAFYNRYDNTHSTNMLFTEPYIWFNVQPSMVTFYPGTNLIKTRTIPNGNAWTSADASTGKTDLFFYKLSGKWRVTPDFTLRSDAVYQDSSYKSTFVAVRAHSPFWDAVNMSMDFNDNNGVPSLKYNNFDPTLASSWFLQNMYDNANKDKGAAATFTEEGVLTVDWPAIKRLKFGAYYDYRKAATKNRDQNNGGSGRPMTELSAGAQEVITGFFDGRADVPATWRQVSTDALRNDPDMFRRLYGGNMQVSNLLVFDELWNVDEITAALYLQVDELNADIAGHKLRGQFGVRAVNIKTGMSFITDRVLDTRASMNAGVSRFLPSASFTFEVTDKLIARAAYSQTLRRPSFSDLNPTVTYTEDLSGLGYGSGSSGNPNLKPTESKNIDFGLDYYFTDSSMLHATVFHRSIDGLVVPFRARVMANPEDNDPDTGLRPFIVSRPDNASDGTLKGVEVGGRYFPKNLPSIFQGLGVEGSYTRLKSEQTVPITANDGRIVSTYKSRFYNVSKNSFTTTLAYERSRYSARLSYAWRSAFLAGNWDGGANPRLVYNKPERSVNFQFGVNVMDGLTINFEATNLTDDIQHSYYSNGGENQSYLMNRNNWIVGRTFAVSARYSF